MAGTVTHGGRFDANRLMDGLWLPEVKLSRGNDANGGSSEANGYTFCFASARCLRAPIMKRMDGETARN